MWNEGAMGRGGGGGGGGGDLHWTILTISFHFFEHATPSIIPVKRFIWVHWWKTSFLATWVGIKATVSTLTREFTVLIYLGKLPPIIINPILILARASFCFRESREGVSQDRLLLTRLSRHTRSWELNVKYVIITSSTLRHLDIKPNHTYVDWV